MDAEGEGEDVRGLSEGRYCLADLLARGERQAAEEGAGDGDDGHAEALLSLAGRYIKRVVHM